MDLVNIQGISKSYSAHQALKGISFDIPQNSLFGLLGPNGAGKTTLIRIITQIIMPDEGQVLFQGKPMTENDVRKIGYLPEERGLYKKMKVAEQLLYLARLKGMNRKDAVKEINTWLDRFEIRSWINKKVEDLSKGMQQKVQFVATVVHKPSLLILDEPFSGFDPVNANLVKDELHRLKEEGATIIFSTHRMESVEELCDHITLINKANIVLNGSKQDIKNAYRNGTYLVEHVDEINLDENIAHIVSSGSTDLGYNMSEIKLAANCSVNEMIGAISNQTELISFNEKIPSVNDIFIEKVKSNGNE